MNRAKFLVLGALLLSASPVLAQDATPPAGGDATPAAAPAAAPAAPAATEAGPAKKMGVGVDVIGVVPLGDYSNASSFALGAAGRFWYTVMPKLAITARVGYLYHFGTPANTSLYIIPVHVGAEYELAPKIIGWAELGLDHIATSVDFMGMSASASDDKFGFALGAGYRVMPKLTVKAGFYMPGSESNGQGGSTTLYGIILSAGYDITAF